VIVLVGKAILTQQEFDKLPEYGCDGNMMTGKECFELGYEWKQKRSLFPEWLMGVIVTDDDGIGVHAEWWKIDVQ
jgi:hypothetical protein